MGDPLNPATSFGPQVDKAQFETILQYIQEAQSESNGANLIAGGQRATEKGYYIQPTIFVNVPDSARILTSEIFGPVVVVQQFETEEEVIGRCNDTTYGLHASIFTGIYRERIGL